MKIAPNKVTDPKKKNIPWAPIELATMNYIVIDFSSRLAKRARTHRPRAVSTATSAEYIQAIGP